MSKVATIKVNVEKRKSTDPLLALLNLGREVHIDIGDNTFVLVKDGIHIVATANEAEQHNFNGCRGNEIKQILEEYRPGDWSKPSWE